MDDVCTSAPDASAERKRYRLQRVGQYALGKTIGRGNFAEVRLARHELSRCRVAMKIVDRLRVDADNLAKIDREIRILKSLHHPHIIKLYQVIRTERYLYIVTEYAGGGEMFELLMERGKMSESEARRLFRQIVSALAYCHANGIVHRDLKAENLLLDGSSTTASNVKLIDFGFSNFQSPNQLLSTWCGSPPYAAPELLIGHEYDGTKADVWSLGVVLYILVTGGFPFPGDSIEKLKRAVIGGQLKIPYWVSVECADLIRKMLTFNPAKRYSVHNVMQHRWYGEPELVPSFDAHCRLNGAVLLFLQQHTGASDQLITQAIVERDFESGLFAAYSMLCDKLSGSGSLETLESPEVRRGSRGSILSGRVNVDPPASVIPAHHLAQLSLSTTPDYDSDDESSASDLGDDSSTPTSSRRYRIRHPSASGDRAEIRRHTLCSADGFTPLLLPTGEASTTGGSYMRRQPTQAMEGKPAVPLPRVPLFLPPHILHLPSNERRASAGETLFGPVGGYEQLMAVQQQTPSTHFQSPRSIEDEGEQYLRLYGSSKRNTVHGTTIPPGMTASPASTSLSPGRHCPYWKQNGERRSSWTGGGLVNPGQLTQLERLYRQSVNDGGTKDGNLVGIHMLQREFQQLNATTAESSQRVECRAPLISITDEHNRSLPGNANRVACFDPVEVFSQQAEEILYGQAQQERPATVIGFVPSSSGASSPDRQSYPSVDSRSINGRRCFIAKSNVQRVLAQLQKTCEEKHFTYHHHATPSHNSGTGQVSVSITDRDLQLHVALSRWEEGNECAVEFVCLHGDRAHADDVCEQLMATLKE